MRELFPPKTTRDFYDPLNRLVEADPAAFESTGKLRLRPGRQPNQLQPDRCLELQAS
jgi:hypothetical protein